MCDAPFHLLSMSPLLQAFVKRLLQICPSQSPTFICASLITLSELAKHWPSVISLRYSGQVSYPSVSVSPVGVSLIDITPRQPLSCQCLSCQHLSCQPLSCQRLSYRRLSCHWWCYRGDAVRGDIAGQLHAYRFSDSWMKIVETKGLSISMTKKSTTSKSRIPQIRLHSALPPGSTRVTSPVSWICFTVTCFIQHHIYWCVCSITPLSLVRLFYHTTSIGASALLYESLQRTMTAL